MRFNLDYYRQSKRSIEKEEKQNMEIETRSMNNENKTLSMQLFQMRLGSERFDLHVRKSIIGVIPFGVSHFTLGFLICTCLMKVHPCPILRGLQAWYYLTVML